MAVWVRARARREQSGARREQSGARGVVASPPRRVRARDETARALSFSSRARARERAPRKNKRCWFFLSVSSGIFVNVGRSLRLPRRAGADGAHARFGIPCVSSAHCDKAPGDKLYCHFAIAAGYDSVRRDGARPRAHKHDAHISLSLFTCGRCKSATRTAIPR